MTFEAPGLEDRFRRRLRSPGDAAGSARILRRMMGALGPVGGLRILDVGCGTGQLCRCLARSGASVTGIDPCGSQLARARRRAPGVPLACADATRLPFSDGCFDVVTAVLVLHYLADLRAGLRELARVVRPGGRILICDRICSDDPVLRAAQIGVERLRNPLLKQLLSKRQLRRELAASGLRGVRLDDLTVAESLNSWLSGTDPVQVAQVREEVRRLQGRNLVGWKVASGDRIELRLALAESRRPLSAPVNLRTWRVAPGEQARRESRRDLRASPPSGRPAALGPRRRGGSSAPLPAARGVPRVRRHSRRG